MWIALLLPPLPLLLPLPPPLLRLSLRSIRTPAWCSRLSPVERHPQQAQAQAQVQESERATESGRLERPLRISPSPLLDTLPLLRALPSLALAPRISPLTRPIAPLLVLLLISIQTLALCLLVCTPPRLLLRHLRPRLPPLRLLSRCMRCPRLLLQRPLQQPLPRLCAAEATDSSSSSSCLRPRAHMLHPRSIVRSTLLLPATIAAVAGAAVAVAAALASVSVSLTCLCCAPCWTTVCILCARS